MFAVRSLPTAAPLLLLLCAACASEPDVAVARAPIIGGQIDNDHTAVVALVMKGWNEQFCTGTVIAPRAVLTAGHCIEESGIPASQMAVFFGTTVGGGGTSINVTSATAHPSFYTRQDGAPMYDVAVVTLAQDAPVTPLPWQRKTLTDPTGQTATLVGYGVTNAQQQTGNGTRRVVDEVVTGMDADFIYYGGGVSGTCQGDSGGPMFLTVNGTPTVVGVTSFGDQSCVQVGANTRVDKYADFIAPLAPVPLTVAIDSPTDGSTQGHSFTVDVQADSLAGVTKVDLTVDGAAKGSLFAPPWNFDLAGLADGTHEIAATATAGDGQTGNASAGVNVVTVAFGGTCTENGQCAGDVCVDGETDHGYCTQLCSDTDKCPSGSACQPIDPSTSICGPPGSAGGGCAVGTRAGSGAGLGLLLVLAALLRRRRR